MGKRVRKSWGVPSEQAGIFGLLVVFFLFGGVAGSLFASCAEGSGAQELSDYLAAYLAVAKRGEIALSLWPVLWGQLRVFLLILIFGTVAVGVVGMPALFAVQGFFLSFSVGCFCRVFGWRGMLPAFVLFGLPALLWIPALLLAGTAGMSKVCGIIGRENGNTESRLGGYWGHMGAYMCILLLVVFVEYFVVPVLLRGAASFVL